MTREELAFNRVLERVRLHGDLEGNDAEIADLVGLLKAAWAFMGPEQRTGFLRGEEVEALKEVTQ